MFNVIIYQFDYNYYMPMRMIKVKWFVFLGETENQLLGSIPSWVAATTTPEMQALPAVSMWAVSQAYLCSEHLWRDKKMLLSSTKFRLAWFVSCHGVFQSHPSSSGMFGHPSGPKPPWKTWMGERIKEHAAHVVYWTVNNKISFLWSQSLVSSACIYKILTG